VPPPDRTTRELVQPRAAVSFSWSLSVQTWLSIKDEPLLAYADLGRSTEAAPDQTFAGNRNHPGCDYRQSIDDQYAFRRTDSALR
jgi:hypothetical protein